MLFNSYEFFIFFSIFFCLWIFLKDSLQIRWIFLTISSFIFYAWWSAKFIWLLIFTGVIDFSFALLIYQTHNNRLRKIYFCIPFLINISILVSFKYAQFFLQSFDSIYFFFTQKNLKNPDIPGFFKILPIGISFYTFESLSYVFDVYKRKLTPTKNIFHYFSFLAMFPRLIAGPIERPHHLLPQLLDKIKLKDENIYEGLKLIIFGFFKKTFLADNLALIVNTSFSNVNVFSGIYWWYTMICFSIQIYCDFSGYTDIARGLAKVLGFDFSLNFKSPYSSISFKDFWSQWHISLSTWFRDYLYIPLGGDRISPFRTHINLWITMLVSGLWHGASWNFVIWGALHSFYLSIEKWTQWPSYLNTNRFGKALSTFLVFLLTVIAWVFFRADSFSQALLVLHKMVTFSSGKTGLHLNFLVFIGLLIHFIPKINIKILSLFKHKKFEIFLYATLALIALAFRGKAEQFIYFQF